MMTVKLPPEANCDVCSKPISMLARKGTTRHGACKVEDGYRELALSQIDPNPNQPRKRFDEDALNELATSIRQHGLMQPIVVRPQPDGRFQIVAGERRWRAMHRTDLTKIPARVMTMGDETMMILSITENVARRDMDEIEEANAYASLTALGKTVPEIAGLFGKTEKAVETSLDLLKLVDEVQWLVQTKRISKNIGVHLSRLSLAGQQTTLARIQTGEFADNDALIRHVSVIQQQESQSGLFQDMLVEADPFTEARRSARRTEIAAAWDRVEKLSGGLTPLLETTPEDIAFAVAGDITLYAARLSALQRAVTRAHNNVRQAAAIAKVVLPEEVA